LLLDNTFYKRV